MLAQSVFYNTKDLPSDILTLVDDRFYAFIEQRLGVYQSSLLKLQQINSVPCLLLTDDPCQVLNLSIDDNDLNELKKHMCFLLLDGTLVVKPGIKTSFKCLRDLLTKKTEEKLKHTRNTKTQSTIAVPFNILTSPSSLSSASSFSTPPVTTTTSQTTPPVTTTTSQTTPPVTTTTSQTTPPVTTTTSQTTTTSTLQATTTTLTSSHDLPSTSITEHRKYVLDLLKQWCLNHKNEFMLDKFDLKEGKDFILNVIYDQNNDLEASIKCNCSRVIILSIKNGKIQLSNFQKHLRMTSCSYIKAMKEKDEEQKKLKLQQTTNILSSSTAVTLTATAPPQQSISQGPVLSSTGASSVVVSPTSYTQTTISQTSSRKRGQASSQLSATQKTKKRCT